MFVDELRRGGDDGALVFDGTGTTAFAEVLVPGSDMHHAWITAAPALRGACRCCAKSCALLATRTASDSLAENAVAPDEDDKAH